jgi:protein-tyrosine-phosphatase
VRGAIDVGLVLFVCSENSFRSQMAEAYFNKLPSRAGKPLARALSQLIVFIRTP